MNLELMNITRMDQAQSNVNYVSFFPNTPFFVICVMISTAVTGILLLISLVAKLYKGPLGTMSFYVLLSDFLFGFPKVIAYFQPPTSFNSCNILQGISHYGLIASFFWAAFFGHAVLSMMKYQDIENLSKYISYYFILGNILPITTTIGSMYTDFIEYLPESNLCVHKVILDELDYQYIIYTSIPLLISCVLSIIWYILAAFRLKQLVEGQSNLDYIGLMLYPAVLLICWLPNLTINTIMQLGRTVDSSVVTGFQILGNSQGIFDSMVYGGSKKIIQKVREQIQKCRRRSNSKETCSNSDPNSSASALSSPNLIDSLIYEEEEEELRKTRNLHLFKYIVKD